MVKILAYLKCDLIILKFETHVKEKCTENMNF